MEYLLALLLGRGEIERRHPQSGAHVALQGFAELFQFSEAWVLLADHPQAAPDLIGRAAIGCTEIDLFDAAAGVTQPQRRFAAERLDLGIDADPGDVGGIGDARPLAR